MKDQAFLLASGTAADLSGAVLERATTSQDVRRLWVASLATAVSTVRAGDMRDVPIVLLTFGQCFPAPRIRGFSPSSC